MTVATATSESRGVQVVRLIHLSGVEGISYMYYYDFDLNRQHSALLDPTTHKPRPAYYVAATYNQGGHANPNCY